MNVASLGIDFGSKYIKLSAILASNPEPVKWENVLTGEWEIPVVYDTKTDFIVPRISQILPHQIDQTVDCLCQLIDLPYNNEILQKIIKRKIFTFPISAGPSGKVLVCSKEPAKLLSSFIDQIMDICQKKIQRKPQSTVVSVPVYLLPNQKQTIQNIFSKSLGKTTIFSSQTCALYNYFKKEKVYSTNGKYLVINIGANLDATEITVNGPSYIFQKNWRNPYIFSSLLDETLTTYVLQKFRKTNSLLSSKPSKDKMAELRIKCIDAKNSLLLGSNSLISCPSFINNIDLSITIKPSEYESLIDPIITMVSDLLN